MKLSIIIPVYNTKKNDLLDCINSIDIQKINDIEVIIVDDGSNADSACFLDSIVESRHNVKVFHKKNEGVSVARNYGVSKAQGEYIMFMDADDELMPGALNDGIEMMKETHCDIAIGQICYVERNKIREIKADSQKQKKRMLLSGTEDKNRYIVHLFDKKQEDWGRRNGKSFFNFEGCWARIIKTEIAKKIFFTPGLKISEDTEWSLNTVIQNPQITIGLSYNLWYLYINNPYSALNTFKKDMPERIYKGILNVRKSIEEQDLTVKEAYLQWLFIKLKQLIFDYYYAPECNMTCAEKVFAFRKFMKQPAFKNMNPYFKKNLKLSVKWMMYCSGVAVVYYKK